MSDPIAFAVARPGPTRAFGRFELRELLGRSQHTMSWLAFDARDARDTLLTLPRVAPADALELQAWLSQARQAARLDHPQLAAPIEVGAQDQWPYIACARSLGITLGERLAAPPWPSHNEAAGWLCQALEGLAFAHEAGIAHQDPQWHNLLIDEQGRVRVMALGAAGSGDTGAGRSANMALARSRGMPVDPALLRAQREEAEGDVLAVGILAHHLICGTPAFDEPDVARVIERLSPRGNEILRLPWSTPAPVSEVLRAIVNRATGHPPRNRYHGARTLLRALQGWREADAQDSGGPIALLLDRLHTVGHLPALPNVGATVVRLSRMERESTAEMAEQVLLDMALSFELLRQVNSAQVQGTQASGNGPVLTIRRAIAMLGLDGVRHAASALRAWPGPLSQDGAAAMQALMRRVRLAGHVAQLIRPRGYDPEVIFLIALLQNLGRLMLHYHFAEDAAQIAQLMLPTPAGAPDAPEEPGMSEERAAHAVLGTDVEAMTNAVARHWGLNDEVLHMIRRLPEDKPVRMPDSDGDLLRAAASAGNEVVDAVSRLPAARQPAALDGVAKRYARVLGINTRDLSDALQIARQMLANASSSVDAADAN